MGPDGSLVFDPGWLTAVGEIDVRAAAPGFGCVGIWAIMTTDSECRPKLEISTDDADGNSTTALRANGYLFKLAETVRGPNGGTYSHKGVMAIANTAPRHLWARYSSKGEQPRMDLALGDPL